MGEVQLPHPQRQSLVQTQSASIKQFDDQTVRVPHVFKHLTSTGFVRFEPDGRTVSKVNAEKAAALAVFKPNSDDPLYGKTYQNIIIGCRKLKSDGRKAHLSMHLVGLNRDDEISYSDLLHSLPVESKKGAGVIEFEVEFSPDFKGSFFKWFILPNWS